MMQNSSEWDYEPDALKQRTVGWSYWSWRKRKGYSLPKNDKDQPCVFGSLQHKYVFEAFPVETYKKKVQLFTLINRAVSVALAVLDACWTMQ